MDLLLRKPLWFSQLWGLDLFLEWKLPLLGEHTPWSLVFLNTLQRKALVAFCDRLSFKRWLHSKKKKNCKRNSVYLLTKEHICLLSIIKYFRFPKYNGHILCVVRVIHLGPSTWPLWKLGQAELTELFSCNFVLHVEPCSCNPLICFRSLVQSAIFHETVACSLLAW